MSRECLVAHRGYQKLYPENTLLGYQKAIEAGALYFETDIQLSADLQPVLYHEARLKRVSGIKGKVNELPLKELIKLPAHEPRRLGQTFTSETITPLAALVQLLGKHPEVRAYIEVKQEALDFAGIEATYTAIAQCLSPAASQCCLMSYHYGFIKYARDKGWKACGLVLKKWRDLNSPIVQSIKPDTIFCNYKKIPKQAQLDQLQLETVLFEITDAEQARYWLERGASKIETFDIGTMIKAMAVQTAQ
jgi:glycerophosphoryl diester phosphodiesterase